MRVLHFFKTYFPDSYGGVEQVINQIAQGSVPYGIDSQVLSLSENPIPEILNFDGHQVIRCKQNINVASTGISFDVFSKFSSLAKHADVIHYHYPWPLMDLLHFVSNIKKPTVVTYHSDIVRQKMLLKFYSPLRNKFLASVDKIVATSPNYLSTSEVLQRYKDKTEVIPIGLDKSSYHHPSAERLRYWFEKYGSKFFLFVGVLRYYKGLHILIEAAKNSSYPIVIVGAGPVENELKEQVKSYGLKNVFFAGRIGNEDKAALLKLCHAVVFPSHLRSEAFGISLLEGAMFGKPMVSSEIGTGTSYININGDTGLVVSPNDPYALHQAMRKLWEDEALASKMGRAAESRYMQLFTADTMVQKYTKLYKELV